MIMNTDISSDAQDPPHSYEEDGKSKDIVVVK